MIDSEECHSLLVNRFQLTQVNTSEYISIGSIEYISTSMEHISNDLIEHMSAVQELLPSWFLDIKICLEN